VAYTQADATGYARNIASHLDSTAGPERSLWEFGHLVWRPSGWAAFHAARALGLLAPSPRPDLQILTILTLFSSAGALLNIWIWTWLAHRISGSFWRALLPALVLFCGHAHLLYAQGGSAYVAGLSFLSVALWCCWKGIAEPARRPPLYAVLAGLAMAGAVLCWLPYLFGLPGCAAGVLFWRKADRSEARRFLVTSFAMAAVCTLLVYGWAAHVVEIRDVSSARAWIANSAHGWSQTQRGVRLITGLPRSFVFLGEDGILLKRYRNRDPYAPVSFANLAPTAVRLALW
jgi:hypothetical protein